MSTKHLSKVELNGHDVFHRYRLTSVSNLPGDQSNLPSPLILKIDRVVLQPLSVFLVSLLKQTPPQSLYGQNPSPPTPSGSPTKK